MTKVEDKAEELLERALAATERYPDGAAKVFSQDELLDIGEINSPDELMRLCQQLIDNCLARLMSIENKVAFHFRNKDVASKLRTSTNDEQMIYNHIENAGVSGLWTKALKQRTQIVQTSITKSTKTLESKGLIKQIKSVKNPTQKVYMLSHLSPGEGVTGGPWHSEGELDMELVGVTADAVVHFIEQKSWIRGYVKREREQTAREKERSMSPLAPLDGGASPPASKKRKRDEADKAKKTQYVKVETQISYEPGYKHYPTVETILHFIKEAGFVKSEVHLANADIQGLLDVLVYDDRIEKMGSGYRTIRGVSGATEAMKNMMGGKPGGELGDEDARNGLTQAPCGRCPVFDLCEEGGPVSAKNCVYFDAWLKT